MEAFERDSAVAARRALVSGAARGRRGRLAAAHAVPARPRPDRPLEGVPPAQAQDPGLHLARGRPLPHAAHAHARGGRDRAHGRARARAQRGPDRGDRARPRPRPPAVRAHRRERARRVPARALRRRASATTSTRCGSVERLERDGARAQPDRAGARRDPATTPGRTCRRRSRGGSCGWSTGSPTSTTTSTMRCAPGVLTADELPADEIAMLGDDGVGADRHARARPGRALGRRGRHRPGRGDRRRDGRGCARSCSSASTSAPHAQRERGPHRADDARAVRLLHRRSPPPSLVPGATEAERVTDYLAGMTDRFALRAFEELSVPRGF